MDDLLDGGVTHTFGHAPLRLCDRESYWQHFRLDYIMKYILQKIKPVLPRLLFFPITF